MCIFTLLSCDSNDDKPFHTVCEGKQNMIVYHVSDNANKPEIYGKFEYWITDASGKSWIFLSDSSFQMGDTVKIFNK